MLAPVLMKGNRPVVLPLKEYMADNFLDAYRVGNIASFVTDWVFTNSFIDIDKVKGVHAVSDGMDIVLLSREYEYAREEG